MSVDNWRQTARELSADVLARGDGRVALWRGRLSTTALVLVLAALAANCLLISPPPGEGYPGAIDWSRSSLLRPLIEVLSLGGAFPTARGVEIKDVAFHFLAVAGFVLLAVRAVVSGLLPPGRRAGQGVWLAGQVCLILWVLVSAASAWWSGEPRLSMGQAALFGAALGWALVIGWTLEGRDVPRLLWGYVWVAAATAALCAWYYIERNPFHRPGFPIGNPSTLAAVVLPAFLIVLVVFVGTLGDQLRAIAPASRATVIGAGVALPVLGGCLALADSRGAYLGGLAGVAGILFLAARTRLRRVLLWSTLVAIAAAGWYFSTSTQDVTMARGATVRFRLYTWRYAAELWSHRPISGLGAGSFPRLAGALSIRDRMLDPAAFAGEVIAHAHNELFEVFSEIGLLGGVTFVAGFLATLAAAAAMLRSNLSRGRRWLLLGLVGGVIAVLVDSLFGVGLRLPGLPVVFYTLLGTLWAACRAMSRMRPDAETHRARWPGVLLRRYGVALLGLVAAVVGGWLAVRDATGIVDESRAVRAYTQAEQEGPAAYDRARTATLRAAGLLLDPVRVLLARERAVRCDHELALVAWERARRSSGTNASEQATSNALDECLRTYSRAWEMSRAAPTLGRMPAIAARCAELMADLLGMTDRAAAQDWAKRAWGAWYVQRQQSPYDRETLLAMARYPLLPAERVGLLRDVLRGGFLDADWRAALEAVAADENFDAILDGVVAAVRPFTPETDLDALILSGAPESYRLRALWRQRNGDFAGAIEDASEAVRLYRPMRPRFPELLSVALAEKAEYVFRDDPKHLDTTLGLAREALAELPRVQQQRYDETANPYRAALVRYLLAADRYAEADQIAAAFIAESQERQEYLVETYRQLAETFIEADRASRPDVEHWLDRVIELRPTHLRAWAWKAWLHGNEGALAVESILRRAAEAGVTEADLAAIRSGLCEEFPELCRESRPSSQPSP